MNKQWQPWIGSECPSCGDDAEVFTSTGEPNQAHDGDEARCYGCSLGGSVIVYGDENTYEDGGTARIQWNEEAEPIGKCAKCGCDVFSEEGFCRGCRP